jgi:hypothetical protein
MKKIYTILSFCAVAALFASCQKDNLTGSTFTATIEQCNDSKTKTALNGSILNWVAGDQVVIMNDRVTAFGIYSAREGGSTTTTFIHQPNLGIDISDPEASCYDEYYYPENGDDFYYMAIYPADIVDMNAGGALLPATQVTTDGTLHGFPMFAQSQTRDLRFKNVFGLLKIHLYKPETSITSISVTADRVINGLFVMNYNVAWPDNVPVLMYAEDGSGTNTVTLQCGTGDGISIDNNGDGKDFYIYLPPATDYHNLTINMINSEGGFCSLTSSASVTIPIIRSQYTTIALGDNDLNFIEIDGLFSVAPGQYVQFSPGNLQYSISNNTWRFAPSQIDMIGELNYNYFTGTTPTTDWIDLFSWGETQVASLTPSTTGYSSFYEWGNNMSGGWRTLTNDQWNYLMFQRPDATNKFGGATVAGVKGLILLPDSWSLPAGCTFTPGFSYPNYYNTNIYSATEADAMQSAGAVFLPAAGVVVHGTETHNGQVVPVWYYSHTILDLEEDWFESTGFLAGLGHMIYVIIRDANLYWSSTPYQGQDGLVGDANVYQAYGMAFTNLSGITEDVEHGGSDIFGYPNNIWVINEETNRHINFNDIFNNPTFTYTPGQYIFDLPIPSGLATGAVRLVHDVTLGSSK